MKGISLNPQKNCGFAPYLMFLIEDVTGRSFSKEGIHMPFWAQSYKGILDTSSLGLLPSKSRFNTSAAALRSRTAQTGRVYQSDRSG
jgi:hypothetical protein